MLAYEREHSILDITELRLDLSKLATADGSCSILGVVCRTWSSCRFGFGQASACLANEVCVIGNEDVVLDNFRIDLALLQILIVLVLEGTHLHYLQGFSLTLPVHRWSGLSLKLDIRLQLLLKSPLEGTMD